LPHAARIESESVTRSPTLKECFISIFPFSLILAFAWDMAFFCDQKNHSEKLIASAFFGAALFDQISIN
jgi:hypothetical protein